MNKKKIKIYGIEAAVLVSLLVIVGSSTPAYFEQIETKIIGDTLNLENGDLTTNTEFNIIMSILREHEQTLLEICDYLEEYGDSDEEADENFMLPSRLQMELDQLKEEIEEIMRQGFDNFYADNWFQSGETWIDHLCGNDDSGVWRIIGDYWRMDTENTTRLWARELKNNNHLLYFGITVYTDEGAKKLLLSLPFPEFTQTSFATHQNSVSLDKKNRGGYFNGNAVVDVTLSDGTESTIYVSDPANLADQLREINGDIQKIDIYDHGSPAAQWIGENDVLIPWSDEWEDITDIIGSGGEVVLHGCNIAEVDENMNGEEYLQDLAEEGDVSVTAWTGTTYGPIYIPGVGLWYFETGEKVTRPDPNQNQENPDTEESTGNQSTSLNFELDDIAF
jgi:hypothetical protein